MFSRTIFVFIAVFLSGNVLAVEKGPVSCSITKIDDESGKTTLYEVPLKGKLSLSDARYELALDGFGFRAVAAVRSDTSIDLIVTLNDDQSAHASGVRGLTLLTFTGKTKDGLAHYDFRCK